MAVFNKNVFNPNVFNTDYAPSAVEGEAWLGPPVPRPTFPIYLIKLLRDYFETKVSEVK